VPSIYGTSIRTQLSDPIWLGSLQPPPRRPPTCRSSRSA
jgi:hypothetical protein